MISAFLAGKALADDPQLWSGDGRITAGHLAVLRERCGRRAAGADPARRRSACRDRARGRGWSDRDAAMAGRLLAGAGPGRRTLVVAGNAHTPVCPTPLGVPLGAAWPPPAGVREIRIDYRGGRYYNLAPRRFSPRAGSRQPGPRLLLRGENLALVFPHASEAVVPQRTWQVSP